MTCVAYKGRQTCAARSGVAAIPARPQRTARSRAVPKNRPVLQHRGRPIRGVFELGVAVAARAARAAFLRLTPPPLSAFAALALPALALVLLRFALTRRMVCDGAAKHVVISGETRAAAAAAPCLQAVHSLPLHHSTTAATLSQEHTHKPLPRPVTSSHPRQRRVRARPDAPPPRPLAHRRPASAPPGPARHAGPPRRLALTGRVGSGVTGMPESVMKLVPREEKPPPRRPRRLLGEVSTIAMGEVASLLYRL